MMKLYIKDQMVLPALGRAALGKTRSDAAAQLTASILSAPADTYFPKLSLAAGDPVRLLDGGGRERFLGAVHEIRRTEGGAVLTAYDRGVYLTRNELYGVFQGTGAQIAAQAAERLGLPLGEVEDDGLWRRIVTRAGRSAFSILREAVGEGREIAVENGALVIRRNGGEPVPLAPERVLSVSSQAGIGEMVNRCVVTGRNGRTAASAERAGDRRAYGQFQKVLLQSGGSPADQAQEALRGRTMTARAEVLGDLALRCGGRASASGALLSGWGLEGIYTVTAVEHLWENGLFTTSVSLEQ